MGLLTWVDGVIALTLAEAAWLASRGHLRLWWPTLAAGLALMLALRSALGGGGPPVLAWLAVAGAAHGLDLWRRGPPR